MLISRAKDTQKCPLPASLSAAKAGVAVAEATTATDSNPPHMEETTSVQEMDEQLSPRGGILTI